jgi:blue copper oxidase
MGHSNGRRRFLRAGLATAYAGLGGGLVLGGLSGCGGGGDDPADGGTPPPAPVDLPIPPLAEGTVGADGVRAFALRMQTGATELVAGVRTRTAGYDGAYLGPTLRMRRGERVRIAVTNALGEPATTHWHGMHVPAAMDGNPHQTFGPGETWTAAFEVKNPAGTAWYHPHTEGRTGAQVYQGLAGLIRVEDAASEALGLPSDYGVDDIPLVIQDRRLDRSGELAYLTDPHDRQGMKGDRFLVNGRERPRLRVPAQPVRLRILNGSNARFYHLGFDDGRSFQVIAGDGGLLPAPVTATRLLVAPAERYEIVVDLSADQGRGLWLRSYTGEVVDQIYAMRGFADGFDRGSFDLLRIEVDRPAAHAPGVPPRLVDIPTLTPNAPDRLFTLETTRGVFTINGKAMDMARIDETVALDAVEVWEIRNNHGMAHPFHLHDVQFQVLSRDGAAPPAVERGWKDTVLVRPFETVRIVAHFADFADPVVPYMYHCHILEHEDRAMMGQFRVV